MGKLDIVVVNLARSTERKSAMIALLAPLGLSYSFFEAVDGRSSPHPLFQRFDPRIAEIRRGFTLTPGELGCYASHYLLWERCVRENRPLLIFEDDVGINDNFLAAYHAAADKIEDYGLIRFSGHKIRPWTLVESVSIDLDIIRLKIGPHGTSCYAVSPKAAKKLIAKADVWFEPVDCHLDRFWTHGVGCYGLSPWPVTHLAETAAQSEIWQGAAREKKSRRFRKLRALYRAGDDVGRFFANLRYMGQWKD
ncbi:glycosyltransferase family 25 protein [Agrobacterium rubi]|uniref:glycosyltransferase family 25 protein n=1 Tax=Agrobacterium rubi TaxID=28099 RepID=UPI001571678D|nr:glycosyltransferase family 25 protein [Agrobacterium rubi]NTF08049.1 glycosyltransferase family 25 protein [Agrobacterium rubi]NTF20277.1 glycosyltransferase family 25 protein [Agrobacterium rubi]NTF27248.1 glycosyltransferase family 25 protein [Agrobacterium rubi]